MDLFLIFERVWDLVKAPIDFPQMFWILTPLLLNLLLMEFYFARYKREELGWNTAFGNSLVLVFVSIDLIRHQVSSLTFNFFDLRFLLLVSVIFIGALLTLLDFFHILPKSLAFVVSSKFPINSIMLLLIILTYSLIPLDSTTLIASLIFLILFYFLLEVVWILIPESEDSDEN
ncbi:MAG: hypothetical protein PHG05_00755 [Candidatus Nanoarchaeia archaeon]|nr:hypothetical protein [Candidatus Nanoarchaeia archaeon]